MKDAVIKMSRIELDSQVQYICASASSASLFTKVFGEAFQIITHFLSPVVSPNDIGPKPPRFGEATWQSSFDGSRVWAQKKNFITAGSEASCSNGGSIDCLLLQVIGSDEGPAGGRSLTKTSFIQRLNTNGGSAPATGCLVTGDLDRLLCRIARTTTSSATISQGWRSSRAPRWAG